MNEVFHDTELNERWMPTRNPFLLRIFDSLLPGWIAPVAVFMTAIVISILLESKKSFVILSIVGILFGLPVILSLWIALILPSGFLGLFSSINRLFTLLRSPAFDGSQLFLVPAVFISKVVYASLSHGNLSYSARLSILICSCVAIALSIPFIVNYADRKELLGQMLLVYGLELVGFISITLNDYAKAGAGRRRRNEEKKQERNY